MKRRIIDILEGQFTDYCNLTKCIRCVGFMHKKYCFYLALQNYKNKPTELMKYLYSLDEGLEVFNNEKD